MSTASNVYGILVGVRARNVASPTEYFRLPDDHVVNVGTQIVI
jgi:K+ transporter